MDASSPSSIDTVPNSRVRFFVRAILVLAFAGLFVAGSLSIVKLFPTLALPCGSAHGCDIVNNHRSSKWFGIPVAYIGFGGYLMLAVLAALRSGMIAPTARKVALLGYAIAAFGALTSVGLQVYSLTYIHATCLWCLGSAVLMLLLLVFHALEYGDRISNDVEDGRGEFFLAAGLFVAVAAALFVTKSNLQKASWAEPTIVSEAQIRETPLVPKDAHIYGDKDSPVTIVEFADLMCPVCQQASPKVKEFVAQHPGRVRLVYRHLPLPMHPMGQLAAAVAEAAADKGKFWEFAGAIMATGENMETSDRVFQVAQSVGLDRATIQKSLDDDNGPAMSRLARDINAAGALGMTMTPTFLVQVKGMETQAYGFGPMMEELTNGAYKKIVEAK